MRIVPATLLDWERMAPNSMPGVYQCVIAVLSTIKNLELASRQQLPSRLWTTMPTTLVPKIWFFFLLNVDWNPLCIGLEALLGRGPSSIRASWFLSAFSSSGAPFRRGFRPSTRFSGVRESWLDVIIWILPCSCFTKITHRKGPLFAPVQRRVPGFENHRPSSYFSRSGTFNFRFLAVFELQFHLRCVGERCLLVGQGSQVNQRMMRVRRGQTRMYDLGAVWILKHVVSGTPNPWRVSWEDKKTSTS